LGTGRRRRRARCMPRTSCAVTSGK
jgi:hypothetical protein